MRIFISRQFNKTCCLTGINGNENISEKKELGRFARSSDISDYSDEGPRKGIRLNNLRATLTNKYSVWQGQK